MRMESFDQTAFQKNLLLTRVSIDIPRPIVSLGGNWANALLHYRIPPARDTPGGNSTYKERQMNPSALELRPVGQSGLEISVLGLGCWMFGGQEGDYWGGHDEREAHNLISAALELGVNYFDEAEMYNSGRSEEALGRVLKGRRDKAVIGTKINPVHCATGRIRERLEGSLQRLQTDYIDIYMVHWPIRDFPVQAAYEELMTLQSEGKIRVIGVSNYGVQDLGEALATGMSIGINQMHYNLLSRAIESEVVPLCVERGVGIMGYMALLQGILSGKYHTIDDVPPIRLRTRHFRPDRPDSRHGEPGAEAEVNKALAEIREIADGLGLPMEQLALAWTASKPWMTCVLTGARTPEQLRSNWEGITRVLPADVMAKLDAVTEPLLRKLGNNPDYWQSGANARIR
ncbi:aldo/keto reductase [bacterium]|nr:aldo/keto reductase [bacterium]